MLRTTCIPTLLEGGHAENALPQMARAMVNCRLIPGEAPADVQRTLERVFGDPTLTVTLATDSPASPVSPLRPDLMQTVERITSELWPGVPVVPVMATGGTDGAILRNAGIPTYGISGLFQDINDVRAHGRDERLGVQAFYEGREFLDRLVKVLARSRSAGASRSSRSGSSRRFTASRSSCLTPRCYVVTNARRHASGGDYGRRVRGI